MTWHKRLLSDEHDTNKQWYWSDPHTGEVKIETEYENVEAILEDAKGMERTFDKPRFFKGQFLHHIGFLPNYIWDFFMKQGINLHTDKDMLRKYLNDPNFRGFRSRPGRV